MSASIRNPRHPSCRRRRTLADGRWTLLSALLHVSLLGLALLFPPVRNALFQPQRPAAESAEVRVEGEQLAEIVEQIRDVNREELELRAAELAQMQREMAEIQQEQAEQYRQFAAEEALTAAARALQEQEAALAAQKTIVESQAQSRADKDGQERIQQQQFVVESAQSEARRRIAMATPALPAEVADAQARAGAGQEQAHQAQERVRALARAVEDQQAAIARLDDDLQKNQARQDAAQESVAQAEAAQRDSQEKVAAATAAVELAKAAVAAAAAAAEGHAKADKEARAMRDAEAKLRQAQGAATSSESKVGRTRKTLEEAQQRTQAVQKAAETSRQAVAQVQQQAAQLHQDAEQSQLTAREAQQQARDTLARVLETRRPADQPAATVAAAPPHRAAYTDVSTMNLAQLYRQSVKSEGQLTDTYKEIRSTELAQLRGISVEEARQITDVPRPVRPALNEKILQARVATAPEYHRHSEQIQTALRETQAMVSLGASMLELARALRQKDEQGVSVSLAAAGQTRQMERMAHEVAGGKVADLAGLMAKAQAGESQGGGSNPRRVRTDGLPPPKHAEPPPKIPPPERIQLTRQVLPTGETGGWVAVDTWHTIGPFPNPNRENIHRRFPPETVVDLDASYVGKGDRVIRWMFAQSGEPMVRPFNEEEYGIWYAYTELRFDEARDLWIAVGSDDRSDLWVNDQRVWSSSDVLKGWAIDEGFRRVHFQPGINRILYRIENGWHSLGFSLCLYAAGSP